MYGSVSTIKESIKCGRCGRTILLNETVARHLMTMKLHCTQCRENEKRITNQERRLRMY